MPLKRSISRIFGRLRGANITSSNVVADPSLQSVVPSACCDLDATLNTSYPGTGQTWSNLVPAPADGALTTDYDFFLGEDNSIPATDDPTFNGSAGSSSAYFSVDGADWFKCKLAAASNPRTFRYLHRTDDAAGWWLAMAFKAPPVNGTFNSLFATSNQGGADVGFTLLYQASTITVRGANGNSTLLSKAIAGGSTNLLILSANTNRTSIRCWLNTTTKDEVSLTFGTSAAFPTDPARIFTVFGTAIPMTTGARLYTFALGNTYIDDTDAAAIYTKLEARHSRDYTP